MSYLDDKKWRPTIYPGIAYNMTDEHYYEVSDDGKIGDDLGQDLYEAKENQNLNPKTEPEKAKFTDGTAVDTMVLPVRPKDGDGLGEWEAKARNLYLDYFDSISLLRHYHLLVPLFYDDGEGSHGSASPYNAWNAKDRMRDIKNHLKDISDAMYGGKQGLSSWKGPSSKTFSGVFDDISTWLGSLQTTLQSYEPILDDIGHYHLWARERSNEFSHNLWVDLDHIYTEYNLVNIGHWLDVNRKFDNKQTWKNWRDTFNNDYSAAGFALSSRQSEAQKTFDDHVNWLRNLYADFRVKFVSPKVAPKFTAAPKPTPPEPPDPSTYDAPTYEAPTFELPDFSELNPPSGELGMPDAPSGMPSGGSGMPSGMPAGGSGMPLGMPASGSDALSGMPLGGGLDGLGGPLGGALGGGLDGLGGPLGGGLDGLGGPLGGALGGGLDGLSGPLGGGLDGLGGSPLGSPLSGDQGSSGVLPAGMPLVTGPDGQIGADVTGDGRPDIGVNGRALSGGGLPSGSKVVTKNGVTGIDLDGDGNPDIGMDGAALPGGVGPPGSRWVTGPDGQSGFDVTGNGVPDIGIDGKALPGGDLPPSATYVTGPDGTAGFDLDGDGIADTNPQLMPYPDSPYFQRQLPPPLEGDTSGGGPGVGPGGASGESPTGLEPGGQAVRSPGGAPASGAGDGGAGAGGMGYPPMMPPMMGGMGGGMGGGGGGQEKNERERQTWLQEDDEVWAGGELPVTAVLGRPVEEEETVAVDEWEVPPKAPGRAGPRGPRPTFGGQTPSRSRR